MPIETATHISDLVITNPVATDPLGEADDHMRLIKSTLKTTFPNINAPVTGSPTTLNRATTAFANAGSLVIINSGTVGALTNLVGPSGTAAVSIMNSATVGGSGVVRVDINNAAGTAATALTLTRSGDLTTPGIGSFSAVRQGGSALVPAGTIVMWYSSVASIPAGWVLCDGANGTPDLRGSFIRGAGGAYTPLQTGGATSVALSLSTAPTHSHGGATGGSGDHSHAFTTAAAGNHSHGGATGYHALTVDQLPPHTHTQTIGQTSAGSGYHSWNINDSGAPVISNLVTTSTGSGAAHAHVMSDSSTHSHTGTTDTVGATHTHPVTLDGSHTHTGSVAPIPPFVALCFIMKT